MRRPYLTHVVFARWDTSMSQKSRFKMQTQGIFKFRYTFPQLPGGTIKNPTFIQTEHGYVSFARMGIYVDGVFSNRLLTSGWWAYSRKTRTYLQPA
jgi:delta24(24(1))-sterol reductase